MCFISLSNQPRCRILAEKRFEGNSLSPNKERPRLGIAVAESRQTGSLAAPAAFDLDGPDVPSPGDYVIDLVTPLPPVGDLVFHRIEAIAQIGADGIFHQPPPPDRIAEGIGKGSCGKGVDQGVVPEDQLWAASALALFSP